jgi:hypothetical protein
MSRRVRFVTVLVASALGVGAAALAAAGDAGVRVCADKQSGRIHATTSKNRCLAGDIAITISGDAFRKSKGGTLTINGVAFRRSRPQSITINGTAFKGARGGTLTINGTAFKSSGGTLTINGTAITPNKTGPTGPPGIPGADGRIGPTGPPGIPYGPPPIDIAAPTSAQSGQTADLATVTFSNSDGAAHRVLVTGGFNVVCDPCAEKLTPGWTLGTAATQLVARKMVPITQNDTSGGQISEIVVMPAVCAPCTLTLKLVMPQSGAGGGASTVSASARRLGLVDLGPVTG